MTSRPPDKVNLKALVILLGIGTLLSWAVAFHPQWRSSIQNYFYSPIQRELLSSVEGPLLEDGSHVLVAKYKVPDGILLEFYGGGQGGGRPLLDRIKLQNHQDAHYDFYGQATRLAIIDLNGNQQLELVAPTFDRNFQAHLNAFRYNPTSQRFEPVTDD